MQTLAHEKSANTSPKFSMGSLLTAISLIGISCFVLFLWRFPYVTLPLVQGMSILVFGISMVGWWYVRWRWGWQWHPTSLDWVMLSWAIAVGLSLFGNGELWRRIGIGIWFMGLFIIVWYCLHDLMSNRLLSRDVLIVVWLVIGLFLLYYTVDELAYYLNKVSALGFAVVPVPRIGSMTGNANIFAYFLIMIISLIFGVFFSVVNRWIRILLAIYVLACLIALALTFSRGAWVGLVVALAVGILLLLAHHQLLAYSVIRQWWSRQKQPTRMFVFFVLISSVIAIGAFCLFLVWSLTLPGRQADLRFAIYQGALAQFQASPITGQGLFLFGRGLLNTPGVLVDRGHNHAHNLVLHVAAELGIGGLIALLVMGIVIVQQIRLNWLHLKGTARIRYIGIVMAFVAFLIQHISDMLLTVPSTAFLSLLLLVALVFVPGSSPRSRTFSRLGHGLVMILLPICLVVVATRDIQIYQNYFGQIVSVIDEVGERDYRSRAETLQEVIDADPSMPIYTYQQGFLYGMAAFKGDEDAIPLAIDRYTQFNAMEPGYTASWANLASLYALQGDYQQARDAIQQSIDLDPRLWMYYVNLAQYQELLGDEAQAEMTYQSALTLYPDIVLDPAFAEYIPAADEPLFEQLSLPSQVTLLMDMESPQAAMELWQQAEVTPSIAEEYGLRAILHIANGNRDAAVSDLHTVQVLDNPLWYQVGMARLAQLDGDTAAYNQHRDEALALVTRGELDDDDEATLFQVVYLQFYRTTIRRQLLPGVYFPIAAQPILSYLLARL